MMCPRCAEAQLERAQGRVLPMTLTEEVPLAGAVVFPAVPPGTPLGAFQHHEIVILGQTLA